MKMRISRIGSALVVICLILLFACARSSVIGIDFGSEFVKVTLVQQGRPLRIVEDETSKRKFPAVVGFDSDQRRFGNGASSLLIKRPDVTFQYLRELLGKTFESYSLDSMKNVEYFPFSFKKVPERNAIGVEVARNGKDYIFSVEELMAMIFEYIKSLSETANAEAGNIVNSVVKDCVITVPSFFTQQQRQAILDAASLSGLHVLSLINENTAAAIQYGIDKSFDINSTHTIALYNMGSSSTTVSIMKFSGYLKPITRKTNKTISQFEVIGTGYDENLGGKYFDLKLVELIADDFQNQMKSRGEKVNVRTIPKVMSKIRQAAKKLKEVLSANTEHPVYIEGIWNDYDYKGFFTREQFYENSMDLLDRITNPVEQALKVAKVSIESLDAFVLIGGSVRVPQVQNILKEYLKREELNQNLNGDESPAFGAALHGANLSTAFRVREFGFVDRLFYPIGARVSSLNTEPAGKDHWTKRASLYSSGSAIGSSSRKRSITLNVSFDLVVDIFYEKTSGVLELPRDADVQITGFNVTGIEKALNYFQSLNESIVSDPQITLTFGLDSSSIASLESASISVQVEVLDPKFLLKKTNASNSETSSETNQTTEAETTSTSNSEDEPNETEEVTKYVLRKRSYDLVVRRSSSRSTHSIKPMTSTDARNAVSILSELRSDDERVFKLAFALNSLEGFIYSKRSWLDETEDISKIATDAQLLELREALSSAEEWIYDNEEEETAEKYESKLAALKKLYDPIHLRYTELVSLPKVLNHTASVISLVRKAMGNQLSWLPEEDHLRMNSTIAEFTEWLANSTLAQADKEPYEDPVFTSSDVIEQISGVTKLYERLSKRVKPKPKPKPKTVETNSTQEGNSTSAEEQPAESQDQNESSESNEQSQDDTHESSETDDLPDDEVSKDEL